MITRDEILELADETGLTPHVIEKDYVLGWLLGGIFQNSNLRETWIFKGGTCLKKCYFETYRFSEDLDFTLTEENQLTEDFLKGEFSNISEWLYEETGIEIPIDRFSFDIYKNPRGGLSCEGRIYYSSYFAPGKKSWPKIKLDLTLDEVLVMPAVINRVVHSYSDEPSNGIQISCYAYEEVFGEKVRALGERGRPRDLYDVVNLYRNDNLPSPPVLKNILQQKCDFKKIGLIAITDVQHFETEMRRNWEPMLKHQLPQLPDLSVYWNALPEFFDWMERTEPMESQGLGSIEQSGKAYQPDYGFLRLRTQTGQSLEVIRFAAGNRLCVDLDYTDEHGERKTRRIEPYSLRKAATGNVLLYAIRSEDDEIRSYNVNRINSASITSQVYAPKFEVELSPHNRLNISKRQGEVTSLGLPLSGTRFRGK